MSCFYVYGFRGEDEFFGLIHRDGWNSLGGTLNARREHGWKVYWRRI